MKTRAFRNSFFFAVGVAVLSAAALPQAAQAQSTETDVAVLKSEMSDVKAAIIRTDKRLVRLEEISIRLDERMNGLQMQNQFVIIPLLLLTLTALIALLTKGTYWGVDRAPKASGARRGSAVQPQPAASPA